MRISATNKFWCIHISWENSWKKTFYFSTFLMFLNKWNNVSVVYYFSHILLTPPIKVYPPKNVRKNFAPTKFWQIVQLSPPIIMGWGREPETIGFKNIFDMSDLRTIFRRVSFFVLTSFTALNFHDRWYWPFTRK